MTAPDRAALERRIAELDNLYEIARALLGAADPRAVAMHVVLAAMGTLGARSGALLLQSRRRLRPVYASGVPGGEPDLSLALEPAAWEWLERAGVFRLAAARGLGEARARLAADLDAALGAAIVGPRGVIGLLVLGPHLFDTPYADEPLATLESIAGLAALALEARGAAEPDAAKEAADGARAARRGAPKGWAALRAAHPPLRTLIGESEPLLQACDELVAVAPTRFPVLLLGESGVGKELCARAIHELSERRSGPMEVLDCGSIPRELIESELFGHVRGAFTGAHRDRRGAFEMAHRGTLFLDEIGEMPLQLQSRLLRVLQEGRLRRVGDETPVDVDVRVLAATNRDLRAEVASGRFRQDLFYRLNVFTVRIPALRERKGDVAVLVRHFLGAAADTLAPAAIAALETHAWPGNVRELGNFCAALGVRGRGAQRLELDDLEHVWRRQYAEDPPWSGGATGGRIGDWVLDQARRHRFNLVEAERRLAREKRSGGNVPLAERSALSYYLTGEILAALAAAGGDAAAAARAVAGDPDLEPRVAARVARVVEALAASGGRIESARRRFGKLPADYDAALARALAAV